MNSKLNVVAPEVAEAEFNRFCDDNALDVDLNAMDEDDRKGFENQKRKIIRAMCDGSLIINDKSMPEYTPVRSKNVNTIVFRDPTGAALMAMDRSKRNEDVRKMYGTMAEMTGTDVKIFSLMHVYDLKIMMALTTLFLA